MWANCVHDLVVKTQALRGIFVLDSCAATWKRIPICFPFIPNSSVHVEGVLFNDLTRVNFASITHGQNQMH